MNKNKTSVEDLLGPWVDPHWESGLVLRCKAAWNKPLQELTNEELATFLDQRIATDQVLAIAKDRLGSNVDDDSEIYEGQLKEAIERVVRVK